MKYIVCFRTDSFLHRRNLLCDHGNLLCPYPVLTRSSVFCACHCNVVLPIACFIKSNARVSISDDPCQAKLNSGFTVYFQFLFFLFLYHVFERLRTILENALACVGALLRCLNTCYSLSLPPSIIPALSLSLDLSGCSHTDYIRCKRAQVYSVQRFAYICTRVLHNNMHVQKYAQQQIQFIYTSVTVIAMLGSCFYTNQLSLFSYKASCMEKIAIFYTCSSGRWEGSLHI